MTVSDSVMQPRSSDSPLATGVSRWCDSSAISSRVAATDLSCLTALNVAIVQPPAHAGGYGNVAAKAAKKGADFRRRVGVVLFPIILWLACVLSPAQAQTPSDIYKEVYNGWKWWHVYCYRCHGMNAVGGSLAPNLIDPNEKMTLKQFLPIVKNGTPDNAMQAWDKLLDDKQITQLYYYVRARADKVLPPGRPDEVGPKGGPWVPPKGWTPGK